MRGNVNESNEHLIAYLLGELPESESARIEKQYLADETAFASLMALEAELNDAYARNSLPPGRRRLFEQKFLATPEQRWQLEFSRTLLRVPRPKRHGLWPGVSWPRLAALAAVAAALLVAIVFWRSATPLPARQIPQIAQQTPEAHPQVVIPFELDSGITRDSGEERTVEIPANADLIRVTAKTDRDLPLSYGAVLRKPEGTEIWRNDTLHQAGGTARLAIVDIPAASLSNGHYVLTLRAANQNGKPEDIADYAFRVQKP